MKEGRISRVDGPPVESREERPRRFNGDDGRPPRSHSTAERKPKKPFHRGRGPDAERPEGREKILSWFQGLGSGCAPGSQEPGCWRAIGRGSSYVEVQEQEEGAR